MKKKLYILLIFILIAALGILCFHSCTGKRNQFRFGDYLYTVENKEVTITEYKGNDEDVAIPKSILGAPVVAIGRYAFENCESIKSLTIPDSVIKIDDSAFSHCTSLEHVTLGRGIREINSSPFSQCYKMIYNRHGNGFYIGNEENPYMALVSVAPEFIETIEIHPDTLIVCGSAFSRCSSLHEVVLPEGVISIGSSAFSNCSSLERVHIPDSVISIGSFAFSNCSSLERVHIPDSVISIGSFAFSNCSSLAGVYIPKNVKTIGSVAFGDCDSLIEITVSDENPHFKSVDGNLFSRDGTRLIRYASAQEISSYSVPDGTVIIERSAFEKAKHLTEVVLTNTVEEIGPGAFTDCENMCSINLVNSLKTIGAQAFASCNALTEITIPDSVEELSYGMFSHCKKLETVVIGSGVIHLERNVFSGCDALIEVTFCNPTGWKVNTMYGLSSNKVDLSDPKQNAHYLKDEYCNYYWNKK